ncbi:MAG: leucine-rich repeat domain-containing protein, partial [Trichodesmium sp. St17_bin3_1_1]|nr:leucine-rich repeat domain-containing protein [Trichodesmium sp. St17_bin3_1_1]
YNNQLTGEIPSELGNLSKLQYLYLYNNQLTGEIPRGLVKLSNLKNLYLYNNKLTGEIPGELINLSSLDHLYLNNNKLTGEIPEELGGLYNLDHLYLNNNKLTGEIPEELGNLSELDYLYLNDNQLTGKIPQIIDDLAAYKNLDNPPYVKTNIPNQDTTTDIVFNLDVSDNFDDINEDIRNYSAENLPSGLKIDSETGIISGTPTVAGDYTITITVSDSQIPPAQVQDTFDIEIKQLNPLNTNDYAALKALYESTNGDNWLNNEGWSEWDFSNSTSPNAFIVNNWHGVTVKGNRIKDLSLYENQLTGDIPEELGNLSNLDLLNLEQNQLTGDIPEELSNLSNL